MALADLLLRAPHSQTMRRAGITTGIALLVLYSGETMLRAREWSDQLRFSQSEAAKHPQSPRATYDLARNLVILSNFEPDSPYFNRALVALDGAMGVPESTALPESAAILLAARSKLPIKQAWWNGLQRKLRTRPIGLAETNALAALVDCELKHYCQLPQQDMVGTFRAALEHGPTPELLSIYGNYALNVMQDPTLAFQQWQEAARIAPNVVQYQATLAQILIAIGRVDEARTPIMRVRQLGRLGQNEALAAELERLAKTASEQGTEPAVTPPNPDRRP
jgi:tetratricopeptide (TPR) repeat protein